MLEKVGLSISTLNRRNVFNSTIKAYRRYTPEYIPIVVIDDGSDKPVPDLPGVTVIHNSFPRGIAVVKNQGIAALMDLGVDYLFLSDDDCYAIADDWWKPYVESGEHHLSLQLRWTDRCRKCRAYTRFNYNTTRGYPACEQCHPEHCVYEDDKIHAVAWGSGAFMYFTRECIEKIGGFRTEYGRYGIEHWDIAYRAFNAGLIRYPFQDVLSPKLHAIDAHSTGTRSCVPREVRAPLLERNWKLFDEKYRHSKDFVDYKDEPVVTATVCMPWRPTPERLPAYDRCVEYWTDNGYMVVSADSDSDKPFLCSQARNNAVRQVDTDIIIVADADTIPENIEQIHIAIQVVADGFFDVVWPFTEYRHIDSEWVLDVDADLSKVPVQQSYPDSPGGIIVMKRETLWQLGGFDEMFTPGLTASGSCFGYDDTAFRYAAEALMRTTRIPGVVYSFNQATNALGKPDRSFGEGNPNVPRFELYKAARGKPDVMAELVKR